MEIGEPEKVIEILPREDPIPRETPATTPAPVEVPVEEPAV